MIWVTGMISNSEKPFKVVKSFGEEERMGHSNCYNLLQRLESVHV
jgi:hypothetical protein